MAVCSVLVAVSLPASGASIIKTNNTNALNLGSSWIGGAAPASGDLAVWNSSSAVGTLALGADVSWGGIYVSNTAPGSVTLTNAVGTLNTLTLGGNGVTFAPAGKYLTLYSPVLIAANQTWSMGSSVGLLPVGPLSGTNRVLTVSGSGFCNMKSSAANFYGTLNYGLGSRLQLQGGFSTWGNAVINLTAFGIQAAGLNGTVVIGDLTTANASCYVGGGGQNGTVTYQIGGLNHDSTFAGKIGDGVSSSGSPTPTSLIKVGTGKWTLTGTNLYTGTTTISAGILALGGTGTIPKTPSITVGSDAGFDLSGLNTPFGLLASQTLANDGTSPASLVGDLNAAAGTLALQFSSGSPAFHLTGGTLTVSSNTVCDLFLTGPALAAGNYDVIAAGLGGAVSGPAGPLPLVSLSGGGVAPGTQWSLQVTNGALQLVVQPIPSGTPATIQFQDGFVSINGWQQPANNNWHVLLGSDDPSGTDPNRFSSLNAGADSAGNAFTSLFQFDLGGLASPALQTNLNSAAFVLHLDSLLGTNRTFALASTLPFTAGASWSDPDYPGTAAPAGGAVLTSVGNRSFASLVKADAAWSGDLVGLLRTNFLSGTNHSAHLLLKDASGAPTNSLAGWTNPRLVLSVTLTNGPVILCQPASSPASVIASNGILSLTVVAASQRPLTFQWYRNGQPATNASVTIAAGPGGYSSMLNLTGATPADSGQYFVVVSDAAGAVTSVTNSVSVLPQSWSPNLSVGPQFTEAQKAAQRVAGANVLAQLNSAAGSFTIPPGDYRFSAANPITLSGLTNLVLNAPGVTFWFDPPDTWGLKFSSCSNVTVEGLTIDFDPVPWVQGVVTAINSGSSTVTVQLMDGFGEIPGTNASRNVVFYHPDGSFLVRGLTRGICTPLGGSLLSVNVDLSGVSIGDYLVAPLRTGQTLQVVNCQQMLFHNVNIWSGGGMAVLESGGGPNTYRDFRATRRPGTARLHAFGADGFHMKNTAYGPTLDHCEMGHTGDDLINLHGYFGWVSSVIDGQHLRVVSSASPYFVGQWIDFWDNYSMAHLGGAHVTGVTQVSDPTQISQALQGIPNSWSGDVFDLVLDATVPVTATDFIEHHNKVCAGFVITNSYFHDSWAFACKLNGAPGGTIVNSTFANTGGSFSAMMETWQYMEGQFVRDFLFANNRLSNYGGFKVRIVPSYTGPYRAPTMSNITITNNYLESSIQVISVDGLNISDNTLVMDVAAGWTRPVVSEDAYGLSAGDAIYASVVRNAVISNNVVRWNNPGGQDVRYGDQTHNVMAYGAPQWETVADFNTGWFKSGQQGDAGWYYGTADSAAVQNGSYQNSSFQQFPILSGGYWRITAGNTIPFEDKFTFAPSPTLATVRRWVSPVTARLRTLGRVQTPSSPGNSTVAYIFVNGRLVWSHDNGDGQVHAFAVDLGNVNAGMPVDFVIDAKGNSDYDTTTVSALILQPATGTARPELAGWFRANTLGSDGVTNNGPVRTWPDAAGTGNPALQFTTSRQPKWLASAMNGQPAVRFNGAQNQSFALTRPVQSDFTILCVFQSTQGIGTGTQWWSAAGLVDGEASGAANDFGLSLNANGRVLAGTGNPDTFLASGAGYNDGKPHVATFTRDAASGALALYVDGALVATAPGGTQLLTAPAQLTVGSLQTGVNFFSGEIGDVEIFGDALGAGQRMLLENGLLAQYAIAAPVPSAPSGLSAQSGNARVRLSWNLTPQATGYFIKRATVSNGAYTVIAAMDYGTTNYLDSSVVNGTMYYYKVVATNATGTSAESAFVSVVPTAPVLSAAYVSGTNLLLQWPLSATNYTVYSATSLAPPVVWAPVTNAVQSSNGVWQSVLPLTQDAQRFFRLMSPE